MPNTCLTFCNLKYFAIIKPPQPLVIINHFAPLKTLTFYYENFNIIIFLIIKYCIIFVL